MRFNASKLPANQILPALARRQARELIEKSFAIVRLPDAALSITNRIFAVARGFFNSPTKYKLMAATPTLLEGYRPIGSERDAITGRPDLAESFSAWFRNQPSPQINRWSRGCPFHQLMRSALPVFGDLADRLLRALRQEIDPGYWHGNSRVADIWALSYLQLNFYRTGNQRTPGRDTLMDPHEDGHLLTIVKPSAAGLRACKGIFTQAPTCINPVGKFEPDNEYFDLAVATDEALVIPSSPTFYLSGGLIKPLFHTVVNLGQEDRQSLMFFVNPSRNTPVPFWRISSINDGIDIHKVIDHMSGRFGQPRITDIRDPTKA